MLTDEDYLSLRSGIKGWKRWRLAKYGVQWPPERGWRRNLLREYEQKRRRVSASGSAVLRSLPLQMDAPVYIPPWKERERLTEAIARDDRHDDLRQCVRCSSAALPNWLWCEPCSRQIRLLPTKT